MLSQRILHARRRTHLCGTHVARLLPLGLARREAPYLTCLATRLVLPHHVHALALHNATETARVGESLVLLTAREVVHLMPLLLSSILARVGSGRVTLLLAVLAVDGRLGADAVLCGS